MNIFFQHFRKFQSGWHYKIFSDQVAVATSTHFFENRVKLEHFHTIFTLKFGFSLPLCQRGWHFKCQNAVLSESMLFPHAFLRQVTFLKLCLLVVFMALIIPIFTLFFYQSPFSGRKMHLYASVVILWLASTRSKDLKCLRRTKELWNSFLGQNSC